MSHTAQIQTQLTDEAAIIEAAKQMGLPVPKHMDNVPFGGTIQSGLCVQLPGWRHPVCIDTKTGTVKYDNFGGYWGKQVEMNKFTQMYGVAKATLLVHSKPGLRVQRTTLKNGDIKLVVSGRL